MNVRDFSTLITGNTMIVKYRRINDFHSIQSGDRVVIQVGGGITGTIRIDTVVRITKTQIVCITCFGQDERFMRVTGNMVGNAKGKFGWVHSVHLIGKVVS